MRPLKERGKHLVNQLLMWWNGSRLRSPIDARAREQVPEVDLGED
jgi:hypothetical protein